MSGETASERERGERLRSGDAVTVHVLRGGRLESSHRVRVSVVDCHDRDVMALGQVWQPIFPRSSIKPLQAIPLIESGAADALRLSQEELALACASHRAERVHLRHAERWAGAIGLTGGDLVCGAPSQTSSSFANNCSGKHLGMLSVAAHVRAPLAGYERPAHAVQEAIATVLREYGGIDRLDEPALDGCGVPTWPMPLRQLAKAYARLASRAHEVGSAAQRLTSAMRAHPHLVAGTDRCDSVVMREVEGVIVKSGAEGVHAAADLERGVGIALKVEDGAARAARPALMAVLDALGVLGALPDARARALEPFANPSVRNAAGVQVGEIVVDRAALDALVPHR